MRPKSKFSSELFYALYDYYRNAVLREFLAPRKIQYSVTSKKITVNGWYFGFSLTNGSYFIYFTVNRLRKKKNLLLWKTFAQRYSKGNPLRWITASVLFKRSGLNVDRKITYFGPRMDVFAFEMTSRYGKGLNSPTPSAALNPPPPPLPLQPQQITEYLLISPSAPSFNNWLKHCLELSWFYRRSKLHQQSLLGV